MAAVGRSRGLPVARAEGLLLAQTGGIGPFPNMSDVGTSSGKTSFRFGVETGLRIKVLRLRFFTKPAATGDTGSGNPLPGILPTRNMTLCHSLSADFCLRRAWAS
jgi:hypothetical protein